MRINRYVATASGLSRRSADIAISEKRVSINGEIAALGTPVDQNDRVSLDGQRLTLPPSQTIMLHKPVGYITSRRQQGKTQTIYQLLPPELYRLKPIGRLDRDSSGLLLLTDDGNLAQQLQHPSEGKWKRYEVQLDRAVEARDYQHLEEGVTLDDGLSRLYLEGSGSALTVKLQEGRNRQIRRSFLALGYQVVGLHRTDFGGYRLAKLAAGKWQFITPAEGSHESTA